MTIAFDIQSGGHICRHLAKGVGRRANIYRLPVTVEHQNDAFVQYFAHKVFTLLLHSVRRGVCSLLNIWNGCLTRICTWTTGFRDQYAAVTP